MRLYGLEIYLKSCLFKSKNITHIDCNFQSVLLSSLVNTNKKYDKSIVKPYIIEYYA